MNAYVYQAALVCESCGKKIKVGLPTPADPEDERTWDSNDYPKGPERDGGDFDSVVMNPPFKDGADIKHIFHARSFLKQGGRLVAICAGGPRQTEKLKPLAETWEELPEGTFAGTGVHAVLLTMRGPS
jgi:hypothetical protein